MSTGCQKDRKTGRQTERQNSRGKQNELPPHCTWSAPVQCTLTARAVRVHCIRSHPHGGPWLVVIDFLASGWSAWGAVRVQCTWADWVHCTLSSRAEWYNVGVPRFVCPDWERQVDRQNKSCSECQQHVRKKERYIPTDRQTDRKTERLFSLVNNKRCLECQQHVRKIERQADRQKDRWTDRQKDR